MRTYTVCVLLSLVLAGCSSPQKADKPRQSAAPSKPAAVRITQFYASPVASTAGEPVTLCYGVENAVSVKLDPPVEEIGPSMNRCIQFEPKRSAIYRLIATGTDGTTASQSLTLRVSRGGPGRAGSSTSHRMIQTFAASAPAVSSGGSVTLCYAVDGASSVRIEPPLPQPLSGARGCATVQLTQTTTYTLTAADSQGPESEKITVEVK